MNDKPLPCIICRRELESVFSDPEIASPMQPAEAVSFHAYGQYGSTSFDPMDSSQIHINICDDCLLKNSAVVWHDRYVSQPAQEIFSKPWNPRNENE